jgi:N-acetyl-gamma-glutamyl-phosphate reductase
MAIADAVLPAAAPRDARVAVMSAAVPVVILGAGGYVGGELLRLLAFHPRLQLAAAVSGSQAGEPIASVFPHLSGVYARTTFAPASDPEALVATGDDPTRPLAVFAALPHGRSAATVDALLTAGERAGRAIALVDLSADFRLADPAVYAEVYGRPHAAPERLASFHCGLPDLGLGRPAGPVAHPGCFTTAVTLAAWPLLAMGLASPRLVASAVTGSTGSGREPAPGTHHPDRHGDMKAYAPLSHRHRVEMERLLGRALRVWGAGSGAPFTDAELDHDAPNGVEVAFIPHSGPFARGIHATVVGRLREAVATEELVARFAALYQATPFVSVAATPPRLKEVVGTNRCHLGIATRGREVVVTSVIDNLVKGAAGGAVQWMNRLLGLPDATGLEIPGLGWS